MNKRKPSGTTKYRKQLDEIRLRARAKANDLGIKETDVVDVVHQFRKKKREKKS